MRTETEIQNEIQAITAAKTYVPKRNAFGDDNHHMLDLVVDVLKNDIDPDDPNLCDDYDEDEVSAINDAADWMRGDSDESPSSGWDTFKP